MKKVAIHQPCPFPYLGVFEKILQSDVFILLDDVQFSRTERQNYFTVLENNKPYRITIPISSDFGTLIKDVRINENDKRWLKKALSGIRQSYSKVEHYNVVMPKVEELLSGHPKLCDISIPSMLWVLDFLGYKGEIVLSSELQIMSKKQQRVIDLVKAVDGDTYISGTGAKNYQTQESFTDSGIDLIYHEFLPKAYCQVGSRDFIPNLSVIDFLMNESGYGTL